MKGLFRYIGFLFSLSFFTFSCSTDFDLNAPYQPIPVVYGLLDQSADTQFVKINKSFIGDGNNAEYASINDSLLFSSVSARVEERLNGSLSNTYYLEELWVGSLDDGMFYEDSQKVYYFVPSAPLNDEALYRLVIETAELGEPITAETYLIDGSGLDFNNIFKLTLGWNGLQLSDVDLGTDLYYDPQIKWVTAPRGKRYELLMKFNYLEFTTASSTLKTIYWKLSTQTSVGASGGDDMHYNLNGEAFFEMISSRLDGYANEAAVLKREVKGVEFIVSTGNEDLNLYMEVNEPATGVVTERPSFTNIDGGIGLFASKYKTSVSAHLSDGTLLELCKGQITSGFKFCSDSTNQVTAILNLTGNEDVGCN